MAKQKLTETQLALLAARTVISKKSTWTKDVIAKNSLGSWVEPASMEACAWCASGAVELAVPEKLKNRVYNALNASAKELYPALGVVSVNDEHGHKATLKVFDHAFASSGA